MSGYEYEKIISMLLSKIEKLEADKDEMNHYIDELRTKNVRLQQRIDAKEIENE